MNRQFLNLFFLLVTLLSARGQLSQQKSSAEILQSLKQLQVVGSVLYVAAHPDDENTRLLAYLAKERKFRTAYLSLTRGDGGQNLIGKEQSELLGVIRTQELLAARRIDGAEQFFTRANDFGFSKNPEETFSKWNKDSILSDAVLLIRKFKPDVIICRFPTTGEGGHGHHTASAILAVEAFNAAADPKRFPEQLGQVQVWKAKRIFWNTFNFGTTNTTAPNQLKVDVGLYNALLGKSYGEIASESRSMHKSQGFGAARQRSSNIEYFKLLAGDTASKDLFDNINTSWSRLPDAKNVQAQIEDCIRDYSAEFPSRSIPKLVKLHGVLTGMKTSDETAKHYINLKIKEVEKLILACSGLWLEAVATKKNVSPGEALTYSIQAVNRSQSKVILRSFSLNGLDTVLNFGLNQNEALNVAAKVKLDSKTSTSSPFWLKNQHSEGRYNVTNRDQINKAENDAPINSVFNLTVEGLQLAVERPVLYKHTDPVKGELYQTLEILPALTMNFSHKALIFSINGSEKTTLHIKANKPVKSKVLLKSSNGFTTNPATIDIDFTVAGQEKIIEVEIFRKTENGSGELAAVAVVEGDTLLHGISRIEYDHIPHGFVLSPGKIALIHVDLKKQPGKIAYIPGAGDEVATSLEKIGYDITMLNNDLLATENLSQYSAIVTGIRAFNTNDKLEKAMPRLMEYVEKGGNLIVQYNTNSRVGPLQNRLGPYPFNISRDRVTDENAKVVFRNSSHPVLNFPNQITEKDFEGWVQERGIYFATELDKKYETIFSMNDPGEKTSEGSLIMAKYGAGNFVYTGLSFFRQLPAGIPGAYRLFVNLISLPKNG